MKLSNKTEKIIIFIASLILVAIVTLLYFLDDSLEWNGYKIVSCIVVDWWVMFLIPAFRYIWLKLKDMTFVQGFRLGVFIGVNGIILPILLAPYYGAKYYFQTR